MSVLLGLTAFAPWLMLAGPFALALLLGASRRVGAVVAAALCVVSVVTQLPLYVADTAPRDARTVVVMTLNLRLGLASPAAVVAAVRRDRVDLLMTEELTDAENDALLRAGLAGVLPSREVAPAGGATGTGLWSRWPLHDQRRRDDFAFEFVTAQVDIPGVSCAPTVAALHMQGPWPHAAGWDRDIAHLPSVLDELGATPCALLVGGDFNATPDVAQFRRLLTHGRADAAEQAGAGLTATYPAGHWYPPLIAIDHVLTRRAVAVGVHTVSVPGSDHRGLVASVAVPRDRPSAS